jgi:hypothetical protein
MTARRFGPLISTRAPWAFVTLCFAVVPGCTTRAGHRSDAGRSTASGEASPDGFVTDGGTCAHEVDLGFAPDLGEASEAYVCFGFDGTPLAAGTIDAVRWRIGGGGVTVHHALLYAVTADFPDGPLPCDGMPDGSVGLHVWSPGGDDLALPAGTALRLPAGTRRFVVEVHALRTGIGSAGESRVTLCAGPDEPRHLAALISASAPVPAIRPHHEEHSTSTCTMGGDVHLWSAWPHMHLAGKEIASTLVRRSQSTPLVDVVPWDFHAQRTYPLDVDVAAGDEVHVACTWDNATANYVLPGPRTSDEMCNLVFIGWPAAPASCL